MGKITTTLRRSSVVSNPNDIACVPMLIGPSSAGPLNAPTTISAYSDLDQFGNGPLVEMAAACLAKGGAPVFVCRSETTTPGSSGTLTKTPVAVSATSLYGGLLLPGADANGEVFVTALQTGVSIEVLDPGANDASLGTVITDNGDGTVLVSISLATDGGGTITTTGTLLAAEINGAEAAPYLSAVAQGTGASLVSAQAEILIEDGDLSYTPRTHGVTVRHLASGNNTTLSVSVSTKAITVNLATDANGTPTSTAALVRAAVRASGPASALVSVEYSGDGSEEAGIWAATALPHGSTGSASLGGTPRDQGRLRLQCTRGGTVGTAPYPMVRWSLDDGLFFWSGEILVPSTGIVSLSDAVLDTGVDATFTGAIEDGDEWYADLTEPSSSSTAMLAALQAAIDNSDNVSRGWGIVHVYGEYSRSVVGSIDTKIQAALQGSRKPQALCNVRRIAASGADADESEAEWRASVEADFAGYVSTSGLVAVAAGHTEHVSPLTGRQFLRPNVLHAAARRASRPMHENLGKVRTGPMTEVGDIYGELLHQSAAGATAGLRVYSRAERVSLAIVVSGNSTPFSLAVDGKLVTITCATDSGGTCLTTAAQAAQAIMGSADAVALMRAVHTGSGAGVIDALDQQIVEGLPITHDERTQIGLGDRFVTTTTYEEHPGAVYFDGAQTMRADADVDYETIESTAVILSAARVAHEALFQELLSTPPVISSAESATVPAGAIQPVAAAAIERRAGRPVELLLYRPKLDGEPSASPYGEVKPVEVLRNYSLRETEDLRANVNVVLNGRIATIQINAGGALAE